MTTPSFVVRTLILCVALNATTIYAQSSPAPQLVCGLEVYPSPIAIPDPEPSPNPQPSIAKQSNLAGDPCVDGVPVFGPERFEKTGWFPRKDSASFDLETAGDVCITSRSSNYGEPAKAFPYINLDGAKFARPRDFRDLFDEQIHGLPAGSHKFEVLIVGRRGSYVDIEARQMIDDGGDDGGGGDDDPPGLPQPGEIQIDPVTGALDMVNADGSVRLQNLAADHPYLTPNGDGSNDATEFQALVTPLVPLPGKNDGSVSYFVDWQLDVVDLETCNTIETGLSGSEQINSPTLVTFVWGGTTISGFVVPDGKYGYIFNNIVTDSLGKILGNITSPAFGIQIESSASPVDYDEAAEFGGPCNTATDPSACRCPGVDGVPGSPDPNCKFSLVTLLMPELGLQNGIAPNYMNPQDADLSFITAVQDPSNGRYTVVVDLRDYNAGGLVPKGPGIWPSEASLRQWVSDMTGVPVSTGDSLFNFDYVQLGNSTGVDAAGLPFHNYNHFLLDAMTDQFGRIFLGSQLTNLANFVNDDGDAPPQFELTAARADDECAQSGNTDGPNTAKAKFCAYNTAASISDVSDLGIYSLRTTSFDIEYNGETTVQDGFCALSPSLTCGIRTIQVAADSIEIESTYYVDNGGEPQVTRMESNSANDLVGLSVSADRGDGEGGVCSRSVAIKDGLAVRVAAADGAVPESCIINGIF